MVSVIGPKNQVSFTIFYQFISIMVLPKKKIETKNRKNTDKYYLLK